MENDCLLTVLLQDPHTKTSYYFPPGGKIEENETAADAASRECYEETGYQVKVDPLSMKKYRYDFFWDAAIVPRETSFFRAKLISQVAAPVDDASYHHGVFWIPLRDLKVKLANNPDVFGAICDYLELVSQ